MSLVKTHTPAPIASSRASESRFYIGRQNKEHGIREQLFKCIARNPVEEADILALTIAQFTGVHIGVAGATSQYKLCRSLDLFISLNQEMTIFSGEKRPRNKM
jgi:hypothetical protein